MIVVGFHVGILLGDGFEGFDWVRRIQFRGALPFTDGRDIRQWEGTVLVDAFTHSAEYDEEEGRIEMRLISGEWQEVSIGDTEIVIEEDEAILTEYSHKYTLEGFARMAARAGFTVEKVWTDEEQLFSVQYCTRQ